MKPTTLEPCDLCNGTAYRPSEQGVEPCSCPPGRLIVESELKRKKEHEARVAAGLSRSKRFQGRQVRKVRQAAPAIHWND